MSIDPAVSYKKDKFKNLSFNVDLDEKETFIRRVKVGTNVNKITLVVR